MYQITVKCFRLPAAFRGLFGIFPQASTLTNYEKQDYDSVLKIWNAFILDCITLFWWIYDTCMKK